MIFFHILVFSIKIIEPLQQPSHSPAVGLISHWLLAPKIVRTLKILSLLAALFKDDPAPGGVWTAKKTLHVAFNFHGEEELEEKEDERVHFRNYYFSNLSFYSSLLIEKCY